MKGGGNVEFLDFTQEQQDFVTEMITNEKTKWVNDELKPIQDELLKYKPVEKTEAELTLEKREQGLRDKEHDLILKEEGLSDFAAFINAKDEQELKTKIQDFKKILESRKIDGSYKPEEHRKIDAYNQAEKNKDVEGMLHAKLSRFFK